MKRPDIRPQDRATLAWILRTYPSARRMWILLRNLGMERIRPDVFWSEAPRLWIASCRRGLTVGLALHGDGIEDDWSLHS